MRALFCHLGAGMPAGLTPGLASGVLLALASLPGPCGPLAFVALVPLLLAVDRGLTRGDAARAGLAAGVLYYGVGFGFVPLVEVDSGPAPSLVYAVGLVVLSGGLAAAIAFLAWLRGFGRATPLLLAPGVWLVLEYARSQDAVGAPWLHLGYALADWPILAAPAAIAGVYGLSAWIVGVNAALVASLGLRAVAVWPLVALTLPPALAFAWDEQREIQGVNVVHLAAVQPHIPEAERHLATSFHPNLRRLLELSVPAAAERPHLLVWPESAYERVVTRGGDAFLGAMAHHLDVPLLTGVWRRGSEGQLLNGALLVARDGAQALAAEKTHPLALYERAPTTPISRALARLGLWPGWFEPGRHPGPVLVGAAHGPAAIGVLVCIDTSYGELARELRRRGARLLVEISNEAGTGGWSAALHARIARFRAVELRVPVLRVSNTGPTLWIDAHGRIHHRLATGAGSGSHALALAGAPPPAAFVEDRPVVLGAWGLGLAAVTALRARRRTPFHIAQEALS